jgi:hypothetical protein
MSKKISKKKLELKLNGKDGKGRLLEKMKYPLMIRRKHKIEYTVEKID